jgi:hypothetical protein
LLLEDRFVISYFIRNEIIRQLIAGFGFSVIFTSGAFAGEIFKVEPISEHDAIWLCNKEQTLAANMQRTSGSLSPGLVKIQNTCKAISNKKLPKGSVVVLRNGSLHIYNEEEARAYYPEYTTLTPFYTPYLTKDNKLEQKFQKIKQELENGKLPEGVKLE